jgi:hypothetical protein
MIKATSLWCTMAECGEGHTESGAESTEREC